MGILDYIKAKKKEFNKQKLAYQQNKVKALKQEAEVLKAKRAVETERAAIAKLEQQQQVNKGGGLFGTGFAGTMVSNVTTANKPKKSKVGVVEAKPYDPYEIKRIF